MAYTFKHGDQPLEGITIQRAVGRGGFGEVYYAIADSGKQLAVKYLRENPEIELRGISQVMNLKSPHLITIYDVRRNAEGEPFVLMEYISGPSLRDLLIAEPNGLGPQKSAFFVANIAKGLSYLHERGVVHRDLKPGNIFYDDGYVKIGDYGLSKHISVSAHSGNTVSVGTVHYMAPEIGSGSYTKAIDIYALGVMLFEMLTGRLPFTGSSMGEILMRHLNDRPDMSGIEEPFRSVIIKALAKDPAERFQSADEMADALTSVAAISDSIASFDPVTLTHVPRAPQTEDDQTRTTPAAAPPPPLDVRDVARYDDGIPPIPPLPGERPPRGAKHDRRAVAPSPGARVQAPHGDWRARMPHMMTLLAVAAGVSVGLAFLSRHFAEPGEVGIAVLFIIVGATAGALTAHFQLVRRMLTPNVLLERFTYAGTAAIGMIPGIAIAADTPTDLPNAALAVAAMLAILNWRERINWGMVGPVRWTRAIMPAVVGFATAGATDTNPPFFFMLPAICVTIAMLLPSAAVAWPWTGQRVAAGDSPAPPHRAAAPPKPAQQPAAPQQPPADKESPAPAAPLPPPAVERRNLTRAAQPSFVGRAANAGLAFIAKMLLLAGVVWALGYEYRIPIESRHETGFVGGAGVQITAQRGWGESVHVEIPRFVVFIPFVFGTLLLTLARRNDGAMHFLRGFLGCVLGIVAAIIALGPTAEELKLFLNNNWEQLRFDASDGAPHAEELIGLGVMLSLAFVLWFWPKRQTRRQVVI